MGNTGGAGLGNLGLLEVPHTQTLDLGPGDQPLLLDPAHLDLEASTLSRSFHRSRGNSRATAEEEVLVQIEEPLPPSEESKLSEVSNFVFQHLKLTSRCDFSCHRLLRAANNNF